MTSGVQKIDVTSEGQNLQIHWNDGRCSNFHSMWLRFACPCTTCRDFVSNMTRYKVDEIPMEMTIKAKLVEQGISVTWDQENHEGVFNPEYLHNQCYATQSLKERRARLKPRPSANKKIPELQYEDVISSEKAMYQWLKAINEEGLCLLKGVPTEKDYLKKVINLIGPVWTTLYGELYDVKVERNAINLAYTNEALPLHMDLLQYESAPGIQFLHCLEFDPNIEGGETTFQDVFAVAEKFRQNHPEHFKTLSRVPVTFERIHHDRNNPVSMRIRKPIIVVNDCDEIIAIHWHANLMGPPLAREEDIGPFYKAYQLFGKMISDKSTLKEIRFQPGDVIAYNNRRMTHGRNAFLSKGNGNRHLQGGYINIDEYRSKLMVLADRAGEGDTVKRVFNNDWM